MLVLLTMLSLKMHVFYLRFIVFWQILLFKCFKQLGKLQFKYIPNTDGEPLSKLGFFFNELCCFRCTCSWIQFNDGSQRGFRRSMVFSGAEFVCCAWLTFVWEINHFDYLLICIWKTYGFCCHMLLNPWNSRFQISRWTVSPMICQRRRSCSSGLSVCWMVTLVSAVITSQLAGGTESSSTLLYTNTSKCLCTTSQEV